MRRIVSSLAVLAALAACQPGSGEPANPDATADVAANAGTPATLPQRPGADESRAVEEPAADECGAGKLGRWLNVLPTDTVKAEIAEMVGERPIRYYGPDDAITMDYSPARLNAELGEDGRIKLFRCG